MSARAFLLLGALCAALAAALPLRAATPGVDAPPEAGPPRQVVLPPLVESTLSNGLKVVIASRRDVPVVSAVLLVRHGSEVDPADRAGLASMTAALVSKGALRGGKLVDATGIARQAEALGATLDTGSGWNSSTVSLTVTAPRLAEALALMADVTARPTLAAAELQRAKAQTLDGLRVALAQPGSVAGMVARRAHWGASAYGASPTPQSVQRLTRADVQAFHRQWWRSTDAVLVLAGDVDVATGAALAKKAFGAWRATTRGSAAPEPAPPQSIGAPLVVVDMPGSGQSGVVVTAPFSRVKDADRRIGQVAAAVLAGGYSARFNQEVRIKRGLSYGAGGGGESQAAGGMFNARAQTSNESGVQVLQLLRDELLRLGNEPPQPDELAARQATLVGGFARQLETTDSLAGLVVRQLVLGLPLAELQRYVGDVLAVTSEQVRDFARAHFRADSLRAVLVIDSKAAGAPNAFDDKVLRLGVGELDLAQPGLVKTAR